MCRRSNLAKRTKCVAREVRLEHRRSQFARTVECDPVFGPRRRWPPLMPTRHGQTAGIAQLDDVAPSLIGAQPVDIGDQRLNASAFAIDGIAFVR